MEYAEDTVEGTPAPEEQETEATEVEETEASEVE